MHVIILVFGVMVKVDDAKKHTIMCIFISLFNSGTFFFNIFYIQDSSEQQLSNFLLSKSREVPISNFKLHLYL